MIKMSNERPINEQILYNKSGIFFSFMIYLKNKFYKILKLVVIVIIIIRINDRL